MIQIRRVGNKLTTGEKSKKSKLIAGVRSGRNIDCWQVESPVSTWSPWSDQWYPMIAESKSNQPRVLPWNREQTLLHDMFIAAVVDAHICWRIWWMRTAKLGDFDMNLPQAKPWRYYGLLFDQIWRFAFLLIEEKTKRRKEKGSASVLLEGKQSRSRKF